MNKVYSRIESITGNVISVKAEGIRYGELAEVASRFGTSLAEVIRLDEGLVSSRSSRAAAASPRATRSASSATPCA